MEKEQNLEKLSEALKALEENPDVVAWKVWTKDDIRECLKEDGFLPSDENVDLIMQAAYNGLSDCNDAEWDVIHDAIDDMSEELRLKPDETSENYSCDEIIF